MSVRTVKIMTIDPGSDRAVFRQLADILRSGIESGQYRPGQMLPSETQLMGDHGLSRATARLALAELRKEGLIVTVPRLGSYVRGAEAAETVRVEPSALITSRMPSAAERRELGIPEGVPVLVISREGGAAEVRPADRTVIEIASAGASQD